MSIPLQYRALCSIVHGTVRAPSSPRLGFAAPEKRSFRGHCALPCVVYRACTAVHGLSLAWIEAARIFAQKQHPRGLQNAPFPLQGRSGAPVSLSGPSCSSNHQGVLIGAEGPRSTHKAIRPSGEIDREFSRSGLVFRPLACARAFGAPSARFPNAQ